MRKIQTRRQCRYIPGYVFTAIKEGKHCFSLFNVRLHHRHPGAGGRASLHLATLGLLMGLHVRVGMEDTVWKWPHSDEMIQRNVDAVREVDGVPHINHPNFRWAFGWRVMAVATVFWGCNAPANFYWTGGAFLRQDWIRVVSRGSSSALAEETAGATGAAARLFGAEDRLPDLLQPPHRDGRVARDLGRHRRRFQAEKSCFRRGNSRDSAEV